MLTHDHEVRDPQQGRDEGVAAGLLEQAVAGVDQDDGKIGGRAPVTMLRVYCTWPGVSAMMNLRLGVAK